MTCSLRPLLIGWLASGCYVSSDGLVADLSVRVPSDGLTMVDDTTLLTNDLGVQWRVEDGDLRIATVTLVGCDGELAEGDVAMDQLWLLDLDQDLPLATLTPPPGAWCAVEVVAAPVRTWGADAVPRAWALTLTEPAGLQHAVESLDTHVLTLPLDPPLRLDRHRPDAAVVVTLPLGRWLDGVPTAATDDVLRESVARQLRDSASAEQP